MRQRIGGEADDMVVWWLEERLKGDVYFLEVEMKKPLDLRETRCNAVKWLLTTIQNERHIYVGRNEWERRRRTREYFDYSAPNPAVSSIAKTSLRSRLGR